MVEEILDLNLETIPGIATRTKEKLKENSVEMLLDLASASSSNIEEILSGKEGNATALILSARCLDHGVFHYWLSPFNGSAIENELHLKFLCFLQYPFDEGRVEVNGLIEG